MSLLPSVFKLIVHPVTKQLAITSSEISVTAPLSYFTSTNVTALDDALVLIILKPYPVSVDVSNLRSTSIYCSALPNP